MFKKTIIATATLLSVVSHTTQADQSSYFGANFSTLNYSEEGFSDDASLTSVNGRLGTNFNENFSGEIRVGTGIGDGSINGINVELDSMYGAYIRGGIKAGESFFPYAVLGYTRGKISASFNRFSASASESDVSFGLGADFFVNEKFTINVEYMSYFDKDGAEIDGFSLGFVSSF